MSNWTHIQGSMKLFSSVYSEKINKKGEVITYIAYPEEQFKLSPAKITSYWNKKDKTVPSLTYTVYEYSLPKVKPLFKKWMKEILPQGETGFTYYLNQRPSDFTSSCSTLFHDCEKKLFKQTIEKMYENEEGFYRISDFKFLEKLYNLRVDWVQHCTDFTLTLSDDIRYCSGKEMLGCIETLLNNMAKNDISIDNCCLVWYDDYNQDFHYMLTQEHDSYKLRCDILSNTDNSILASKWYGPNENTDLEGVPPYKTIKSDNWVKYIGD